MSESVNTKASSETSAAKLADYNRIISVVAQDTKTGAEISLKYTEVKVCGSGNVAVVFAARLLEKKHGDVVDDKETQIAIKKVEQNKRYKNRELQIMKEIAHPNVVDCRAYFYANGDTADVIYLNLVLDFVPETVYRASRHYAKLKNAMPMLQIKLYMYQTLRAIAYLHSIGIFHGDIKPQNLLLDPSLGVVKVCDFGTADILAEGRVKESNICSQYYRAPELLFGSTSYTTSIDDWSAGCVMGEMMLGQPIFPGDRGIDQLVEIIKVLGTPTVSDIEAMNPKYKDHRFPQIKPHPWNLVFRPRTPPSAIDLIDRLLIYNPEKRLTSIEALTHGFFDDLRVEGAKLPNGKDFPALFDFTRAELSSRPDLIQQLVPLHARSELKARGIDVDNLVPVPVEDLRVILKP